MKIHNFQEFINESLPREKSVEQWEKVRKASKGIDIGDKIADMSKSANILYIQNPIDTGIESYEDYMKHDKDISFKAPFNEKNPLKNQESTPREYIGVKPKNGYKNEPKHLHHKTKKTKS